MVDLSSLSTAKKSGEGVEMPLLDPETEEVITHKGAKDSEPVAMYLVLLGPSSPETKRALHQMQHRLSKKKADHSPSNQELEAQAMSDSKVLSSLTVGGKWFMGGKWIQGDSETAYALYMEVESFRSQAMLFILKEKNYRRG